MAIYSDEKRPVLAKWIKYTILINVIFFIILVLFWILTAGLTAGITHTGTYATILIGLNVAAFLFYEQLFRPDDDPLRRAAEILGSLQVVCAVLTLIFILGTTAMVFSPDLAGIFPVAGGSQPVVAGPTQSSAPVSAVTQVAAQPTDCYQTAKGCMPYAPAATIPPYGTPISQNDPIIGSFIFDKLQFDPKQNYNSRAGNYEYNYQSVPLDHSPDIKWTFRDDGVVLFYDTTNGNLLRSGAWSKTDLETGRTEYRIKRGNYDYRGTFQNTVFQITSPTIWNMTKVP